MGQFINPIDWEEKQNSEDKELKSDVTWLEAVQQIEGVINLRASELLRDGGHSREAHQAKDNLLLAWKRILKG